MLVIGVCEEVIWDPLLGRTHLALCKIKIDPGSTKKYNYDDDDTYIYYLFATITFYIYNRNENLKIPNF